MTDITVGRSTGIDSKIPLANDSRIVGAFSRTACAIKVRNSFSFGNISFSV
jgi:hypothetical protein